MYHTNGNVRRNFEYETQRSQNSQQSNNPFAEFEWMGEIELVFKISLPKIDPIKRLKQIITFLDYHTSFI